jgi:hypothetical protein
MFHSQAIVGEIAVDLPQAVRDATGHVGYHPVILRERESRDLGC